ncbi:uncharacterized protein [Nicotiana tomentosiformis]|uniref:uncharacterized protein n=1 Tax=Nicotiana tomentosiformis TaxID=4098 RepID=UPI00388C5862
MADVPGGRGAAPPVAKGRGRGTDPAFARGQGRPRVVPIVTQVDLVEDPIIEDQGEPDRVLACVVAQSSLFERNKAHRYDDLHLLVLRETVLKGGAKEVTINEDGVLRLQGLLCVPNIDALREKILEEAHSSRYSIHPSAKKMYGGLRQHYWWRLKKNDIVEYVARCLNCHKVKYEYQRSGGLHQQMVIPE